MEKMRALGHGGVFVVLFSIILFFSPRFAHAMEPVVFLYDTDLPGMDYRSFDLSEPQPIMCDNACREDPEKCKAWTYVKPGIQGQMARCWLKSRMPSKVTNTCCVSGIMSQNQPSEFLERGKTKRMLAAPCTPLAFVTTSPLPSTGVGWDYSYQLQVSGGVPPINYSTPYYDEKGAPMPPGFPGYMTKGGYTKWYKGFVPGLTLTTSGLIKGQPLDPNYYEVNVIVTDSCPSGAQRIEKKFVIDVKGPASK